MNIFVTIFCYVGVALQSCSKPTITPQQPDSNPGGRSYSNSSDGNGQQPDLNTDVRSYSNNSNGDGLLLAFVIHRHGDRNILSSGFPKNPYGSEKHWHGGFGALTETGKRQAFELGTFLGKRYESLIGTSLSSGKVYYRSTRSGRTIMTAQCCATGLFNKGEASSHDVQCERIPITTLPYYKDYLLHPSVKCKRHQKLMNDYQKSRKYKSILWKNKSLIRSIVKNTGRKIHALGDIHTVNDILFIENLKGFRLPKGLNELLKSAETLEKLAAAYFASYTHSKETKKLKAGYLIGDILNHFNRMANSRPKSDHRLYVYSTHDTKIISVLDALKLFDNKLPPYASSLHFELYKRESSYFIQLFYRRYGAKTIKPLNIPHCGIMCPLSEFQKLYKDILPTQGFSSACHN